MYITLFGSSKGRLAAKLPNFILSQIFQLYKVIATTHMEHKVMDTFHCMKFIVAS